MTKEQRSAGATQIGLASLGAFLGVVIPILGGYAWLDNRFDAIEIRAERLSGDRWRGRDQQAWAAQLQAANPTAIHVPPVVLPEAE